MHIEVQDYVPHKLSALAEALANPIAYQTMVEKRSKQLEALTDDEGNRERAENEAADIEVNAEDNVNQLNNITSTTSKGIYSLSANKQQPDELSKESLDRKLGDDEHVNEETTSGSNVTSLTRRMKSVRNFFAGGSGSSTTPSQQQQQSISSGLASAAITANTINQTSSSSTIGEQNLLINQQQQQQTINIQSATSNFVNSSSSGGGVSVIGSSLAASTDVSCVTNAIQPNLLQRQDTQTNLGVSANATANQMIPAKTSDVTASNQLEISDVPSILESPEIINQDAESLTKLREHKRVVKVQLEMDRELAALRKKHNKQLEKEITIMNQKRDKLITSQTKQRSLLAKTHSKLSRKSISSDK